MRRTQRKGTRIGRIIPFHRPVPGQDNDPSTGPPDAPVRPPSPPLHPVTDSPRLLNRVRTAIRARHMSPRTEEAYVGWIRRFILFHGKRHPDAMGEPEVSHFLSALATEKHVAASTQNQALAALLFLYDDVLGRDLDWLGNLVHAKRAERIPVVLTPAEVARVLAHMNGVEKLCASLLYGSGLRILECLRLRVKDIDFDGQQVHVRAGKGDKDRATLLPASLQASLRAHLAALHSQYLQDLSKGTPTPSSCPEPSAKSTPPPRANGPGNGYSPPPALRRPTTSEHRHHRPHQIILQCAA